MPKQINWKCDQCGKETDQSKPRKWVELKVWEIEKPTFLTFCSYHCLAQWSLRKEEEQDVR